MEICLEPIYIRTEVFFTHPIRAEELLPVKEQHGVGNNCVIILCQLMLVGWRCQSVTREMCKSTFSM